MGKIAFVFSGQGAQYPGMGKSLYENCDKVKELWNMAEKIRPGTMEMCFNANSEELTKTSNTQPCLYLVSLSAAIALDQKGVVPTALAGFSLGEISALAYGKAYNYEKGFEIVCKRGIAMEKACLESPESAMCAVLKLPDEKVEELCKKHPQLYPVNYNCAGQISVSGLSKSVEKLIEDVKAEGGRAVPLAVSGAFHSPFMQSAFERFSLDISEYDISVPEIPVYSNLTAKPYLENVKSTLAKQIISPVLWKKTIENLISDGYTEFIEVGAGKTLCGLIKKINQNVNTYSVEDSESLEKVVASLYEGGIIR